MEEFKLTTGEEIPVSDLLVYDAIEHFMAPLRFRTYSIMALKNAPAAVLNVLEALLRDERTVSRTYY